MQRRLRTIRTELDVFSPEEVFVLYRHGYRVANRAFVDQRLKSGPPVDAPWIPTKSPKQDFSASDKGALEARLAESDGLKKDLRSTLRKLLVKKIVKDYPWHLAVALVVCIALLSALAYGSYAFGTPKVVVPTVPSGRLAFAEAAAYAGTGWVTEVPSVVPLAKDGYVYTLATAPIGSLTNNQPHAASVMTLERTAAFDRMVVHFFLEQRSGGEWRLSALQQAGVGLKLPAGSPTDRILGLLVSPTSIPDPQSFVSSNLIIRVEGE